MFIRLITCLAVIWGAALGVSAQCSQYERVDRSGTVLSWHDGMITLDVSGQPITLFAGFADKNTAPAIGRTVLIAYNPTCYQVHFITFTSYPFQDALPTLLADPDAGGEPFYPIDPVPPK
jgi:hypothetical protein